MFGDATKDRSWFVHFNRNKLLHLSPRLNFSQQRVISVIPVTDRQVRSMLTVFPWPPWPSFDEDLWTESNLLKNAHIQKSKLERRWTKQRNNWHSEDELAKKKHKGLNMWSIWICEYANFLFRLYILDNIVESVSINLTDKKHFHKTAVLFI